MLQKISWFQFGVFLLVTCGGFYLYVLLRFYRKEVADLLFKRRSKEGGKNGRKGLGLTEGNTGNDRQRMSLGRKNEKGIPRKISDVFLESGKSGIRPGGSEEAGAAQGNRRNSQLNAQEDEDGWREGDEACDELLEVIEPWSGEKELSPGRTDNSGVLTVNSGEYELFRAMGKMIVSVKELVRQGKVEKWGRAEVLERLVELLSGYGQLRNTPYQDGINNFLIRTYSTNFSILLGEAELSLLWGR